MFDRFLDCSLKRAKFHSSGQTHRLSFKTTFISEATDDLWILWNVGCEDGNLQLQHRGAEDIDFMRNLRKSVILSPTLQEGEELLVKKKSPSNSYPFLVYSEVLCPKAWMLRHSCCWFFLYPMSLGPQFVSRSGETEFYFICLPDCNILWVSSRCLKRCQMAQGRQTSFKENVPHFLGYEPQI